MRFRFLLLVAIFGFSTANNVNSIRQMVDNLHQRIWGARPETQINVEIFKGSTRDTYTCKATFSDGSLAKDAVFTLQRPTKFHRSSAPSPYLPSDVTHIGGNVYIAQFKAPWNSLVKCHVQLNGRIYRSVMMFL